MFRAMIEPGIRCLLAPNPSAMTFRGTNTYILGRGEVAVLDPGPNDPVHLQAILDATKGETITHILMSHDHHDHSALVPGLKAATGAPLLAYHAPASALVPDVALQDGERIGGETWSVEVIHTPGHTDDHLCFGIGDLCLTGDHVMGWASSAIIPPRGDLKAYIASLDKLAARPWRRFLSSHGDPIDAPAQRLEALKTSRQMREASILSLLERAPMTLDDLVAQLYRRLSPGLAPAARLNVQAHIIALSTDGKVVQQDDRFRRV